MAQQRSSGYGTLPGEDYIPFDPFTNGGGGDQFSQPTNDWPSAAGPVSDKPYNPTDPHPVYGATQTPAPAYDLNLNTGQQQPPSSGGYDYGKAQSSWYNSAPGTSIDAWIAANPSFTQGITSSHNGEYMNLPGGESFDAQRNFGPGQSPQWGSQNYDYNTGRAYSPQEAQAAESTWASQHGGGGTNVGGGAGAQTLSPLQLSGILGGTSGGQQEWQTQGLQDLFKSSMDSVNNPVSSAQFEALRQPIDKARRTTNNAYAAELANRGMLTGSGEFANATGRNEERLAPAFATAVQNASVDNTRDARQTALGALQGGNQYKQIEGQLALGQLDQNRQWNQFMADFGLRKEQVQEMLSQGRVDQLLHYYEIWNSANQTSANGYIPQ